MRGVTAIIGGLVLLVAGAANADQRLVVEGREITVTDDGMGGATLAADGVTLHQAGVIHLLPETLVLDGVTVITGTAGAGGNACNASPFVIALPVDSALEFHGPIDSCAYLPISEVQPQAIVFASEPVPSTPGEVWVWNPVTGFTEALPEPFAPTEDAGWQALDTLSGAHPADALALAPVYGTLIAGLGPEYPAFAERISGLGSGDLTEEGYLGSACVKLTCEADWAILYLDRETEGVFAIWHVYGEIENRIYPEDTTLWPSAAMAILRRSAEP